MALPNTLSWAQPCTSCPLRMHTARPCILPDHAAAAGLWLHASRRPCCSLHSLVHYSCQQMALPTSATCAQPCMLQPLCMQTATACSSCRALASCPKAALLQHTLSPSLLLSADGLAHLFRLGIAMHLVATLHAHCDSMQQLQDSGLMPQGGPAAGQCSAVLCLYHFPATSTGTSVSSCKSNWDILHSTGCTVCKYNQNSSGMRTTLLWSCSD